MSTGNDYDNDGNNIVPCPICLSVHCPSNDGGECPEVKDFLRGAPYSPDWEKEFDELWERMRDNGLGRTVSLDGRMIWDVGDDESSHVFADESIKGFISRLLQAREEWLRGVECAKLCDDCKAKLCEKK